MVKRIFPWVSLALLFFSLMLLRFDNTPLKLGLGILGTLLIIGSEVLYSLRKSHFFRFGKKTNWLKVHIFIGLAGPLFVLYHSSLSFKGLAGLLLNLTIIVVFSGIFGRYIYRLVPRTIKGHELSIQDLNNNLSSLSNELEVLLGEKYEINPAKDFPFQASKNNLSIIIKSSFESYQKRLSFKKFLSLRNEQKNAFININQLYNKIIRLEHQKVIYQSAKEVLKKWRILHIPLTTTLFVLIIAHVLSVFYYGKLI